MTSLWVTSGRPGPSSTASSPGPRLCPHPRGHPRPDPTRPAQWRCCRGQLLSFVHAGVSEQALSPSGEPRNGSSGLPSGWRREALRIVLAVFPLTTPPPVFPPASLPPSGSASVCCPSGSMPGAAPCSAPCSSPPGRHGCVALLLGRALPAHSCALVPRALGGASSGGAPVRATMAPRRRRRRARLGGRPALRLFCCGPWWGPPFPPSLAGGAVTTGASPPAGSREEPSQGGGARDPRHQGRAQPSGKGCPGSPLNREVTVEWSLCGRRRGAPFICGPGLSLVWYSQPVFRRFSDEVPMRLN